MARKSRYADTAAFAADPRGNSTFSGLRPRDIGPAPGMLEHGVATGDRLDRLATHYYDNDRLWWRVGDANAGVLNAANLVFDPGAQADDGDDPFDRQDMVGCTILIPKAEE